MPNAWGRRWVHHAALAVLCAALTLPGLGAPSLWDDDEGLNAEAAREMLERGDWVVPHFNYALRTQKPAGLYWLQMSSYALFGVNEWSARLPAALCGLLTVLLVYELGRSMFGWRAGLLAGASLASGVHFCALSHAATPDPPLLAALTLALWAFWRAFADAAGGRGWYALFGAACGLAVLVKGPVGVALPTAAAWLFLIASGRWRDLFGRGALYSALAFVVVAVPWYVLVTVQTQGAWLRSFLGNENLRRAASAMEGHGGPFYYYALTVVAGLLPWGVFLGPAVWSAWRAGGVNPLSGAKTGGSPPPLAGQTGGSHPPLACEQRDAQACRLLLCWAGVVVVVFSLAATKLPNYAAPCYPALALLVGRFVAGWWEGRTSTAAWLVPTCLALWVVTGVAAAVGLAVAGGAVPAVAVRQPLTGLAEWSFAGVLLAAGGVAAWFALARGKRGFAVASLAASAAVFAGLLAGGAAQAVDAHKAPRALVADSGARQTDREIRLASVQYFQPSLVFYARREVARLQTEEQALAFLAGPLPGYLFVPAALWERLAPHAAGANVVARHYDLYRRYEVLVVSNGR